MPVPLSVVVAARDEAPRLPALLRALEAQTHRDADGTPRYEVVLVDDRSTDGTGDVARSWADAWAGAGPDLRVVTVAEGEPEAGGLPPKKHALTQGVAEARHARLVFTDADTVPPPAWLATLARYAAPEGTDEGAVLVGYGPLAARDGGLNRFVRYETVTTALFAAAGVGWGRPWQAVGRNFSYPRAALERVGGFSHSAASLSGDDDLLVQAAAAAGVPVRYVLDADAFVPSEAPAAWPAFWRQKRRHASAGRHYAAGVLVALGALRLSSLGLWLGAPLLHLTTGAPTGWGVLAGVLLVQRVVLSDAFGAFQTEGDVSLAHPVLEAASALYHGAFALLGALPTPRRW